MPHPNRVLLCVALSAMLAGCAAAPRPGERPGKTSRDNASTRPDLTQPPDVAALEAEVARLRTERDHLAETNAVIAEELRWAHEDLLIIERQFTEFEHHLTEDFGKAAAVAATAEARIRLNDLSTASLPDTTGERVVAYLVTAEKLIREQNYPAAIFFAERARHTIDAAARHLVLQNRNREMTVVVDIANVRKGPGSEYAVVSQLQRGNVVTCLNTQRSWCHIRDDRGDSGWIHSSLLK
jgi:hypothetical protein